VLGTPDQTLAYLFDLDGVLTDTAAVHAAAWQEMFDEYLGQRARETGEHFTPFDPVSDYDQYVDGKPREDGTRSFLASRGIRLPEGEPDDEPGSATVHGLGNWKNQIVLRRIAKDGVRAYPGSVSYLHAVQQRGLARAVVSSSTNCRDILAAAGIADAFQTVVDGVVAAREKLRGKPAPDTYLAGARELGVAPARAAVFEDALAGVAAGRAGGFGWVVGVDRAGQASALRQAGANVVVSDLSDLLERP
jgi:beta-phosphoglucomutase family hydrolase